MFTTIENCRKYNTLVGSLIVKYNDATTELVNQAVAMYGVLKDARCSQLPHTPVNVKSITAKTPWGLRNGRGFFNEDAPPPLKAMPMVKKMSLVLLSRANWKLRPKVPLRLKSLLKLLKAPVPVVDHFEYDNEDDIPEGDANGEEDAAGLNFLVI